MQKSVDSVRFSLSGVNNTVICGSGWCQSDKKDKNLLDLTNSEVQPRARAHA